MKKISAAFAAALIVCLAAGTPAVAEPANMTETAAPVAAGQPDQQPAARQTAATSASAPTAVARAAADSADEKIKIGSELTGFQPQLQRTFQALLTVSCLILLAFGAYKKFGPRFFGGKSNETTLISIVSRHPFGPRSALLVADVAGQRFLLAQTNDDLRLLSRLQTPPANPEIFSLGDLLEGAENNKIAAVDILKLVSNS